MHSCDFKSIYSGINFNIFVVKDTCYVWGRQHYSTFDGKQYSFFGGCSYILVHDADPTSTFQIIVINDPAASYNSTVKRKLKINIDNVIVYLGQKIGGKFAITVNSKPVSLPYKDNPRIREVSGV